MDKTLINIITNNTQQVIKSAGVTKQLEFVDGDNNPVPEGIPYHIHITTEKNYFYMTVTVMEYLDVMMTNQILS